MRPPLRAQIETITFEESRVGAARIDPLRPVDEPCYVKDLGMYQGGFFRTGDGDRRLSAHEVDRLIEEHRQPRWDEELVPEAGVDDLDGVLVDAPITRQRTLRPCSSNRVAHGMPCRGCAS